jgi:hypothetical protein
MSAHFSHRPLAWSRAVTDLPAGVPAHDSEMKARASAAADRVCGSGGTLALSG